MLSGLNWVNYGALLPMKTMIRACPFRCGLLLLSVLLASPGHAADTPDQTQDKPSLAFDGWDAFVERAMADWKVPGLALAVVRDGKVIQMKGYGFRDLEKKLPVTPRTLFAIGSITKSFTVTGLGMLVDEGKLKWDEPVRTYLPDFRLKDPVATEQMTAMDLVTHRSGLPGHDGVWFGSPLSRPELYARLRHLESSHPFRSTWQYNNLMFMAAGHLAERIAGRSWEDFTRDRILGPLEMKRTNFSVEDSQHDDDFARPYQENAGQLRAVPFYRFQTGIGPAGSINSCVEEMVRYLQFHMDRGLHRGQRLLSEANATRMQSPQMVIPLAELPGVMAQVYGEEMPATYGMGFIIGLYRGSKVVEHTGTIVGFHSLMSFLPRERLGLIILTNQRSREIDLVISRNLYDRLLGREPIDWSGRMKADRDKATKAAKENSKKAAEHQEGTTPSHPLSAYAGRYEHPAYGPITIRHSHGTLTFESHHLSGPMSHHHYDIFAVRDPDQPDSEGLLVSFFYDRRGRIDRLTIPLQPGVADIAFAPAWAEIGDQPALAGLIRALQRASAQEARSTAAGPSTRHEEAPYDVVILGGRVVDGTGNAWFHGDVAFRGGRIARIAGAGMLKEAKASERIDARGLVVCPGFIDIQSHSRTPLLQGDGRLVSKVTQGVTTEIMGEGWTNAPANDRTIAVTRLIDPEMAGRAPKFAGPHGFDDWLRAMKSHGSSVNLGSFVGSATIRAYVKGMDQGAPTKPELETMRRIVREAMEDGAFGIASALIYPPDHFVSTSDLIELAKVMAPYGGIYISHIRSEADRFLEALDEAIEIGRSGGVPVEIYHLKAAGRRNWPKAEAAIARIAAARARGLDVGADMYPYVAGSTGLTAILPPSASAGGKLFDRLADPAERARIRAEVLDQKTEWENMGQLATAEAILVLGLEKPQNRKHIGKRLSEIARSEGKHWLDAGMDLILSERQSIDTVYFMMSEENLKLQLRQPWIKFGTDAVGLDPEHPEVPTHPRAYGTFPRILGRYVRDEKRDPSGGRDSQDDVGRRGAACDPRPRPAARGVSGRRRDLRPRDDRRPGHVRKAPPALDRRPPRLRQRHGRRPGGETHRC